MVRTLLLLLTLAVAGALAWGFRARFAELAAGTAAEAPGRGPVPVEVAPVRHGPITLSRTFSGALEATAEFVVAPKVSGRLEGLEVDLGDVVERGQVVALLDDDELVQAVHQAEADLEVARAAHEEAKSALVIAERGLERAQKLRAEGVTSESQLDAARSDELSGRVHVEVTRAGVTRAEAVLEGARIRLGYARVTAGWTGGDDRRVVSERFVDEGGTVAANAPLMSIVELDPIVAAVYVPERDYARIRVGQEAELATDAHPGRVFVGTVTRIAPVFRRATRQARVELQVPNPEEDLKPGMFVRVTIDLEHVPEAVVVPFEALTERGDRPGVFVLEEHEEEGGGVGGGVVRWRPVEPGVREGDELAVTGEGVQGRVVVLGQELCDDGSPVSVSAGP